MDAVASGPTSITRPVSSPPKVAPLPDPRVAKWPHSYMRNEVKDPKVRLAERGEAKKPLKLSALIALRETPPVVSKTHPSTLPSSSLSSTPTSSQPLCMSSPTLQLASGWPHSPSEWEYRPLFVSNFQQPLALPISTNVTGADMGPIKCACKPDWKGSEWECFFRERPLGSNIVVGGMGVLLYTM
ncbi:hypothetical protein CcaverHIS631_0602760 [Cutaneotrichosporon cavernicola]|nr:hypothetical protein CcaverHIS631_0602760 [Cutaneotrichosporon cavernicola]